jgi:glycosyltransferase involved in cell wall biosynthesis
MKWCFLDPAVMDYHPQTPDSAPLGGSQSMAAYLTQALAAAVHDVTLLNRTQQPGTYAGVRCLNQLPPDEPFDVMVAVNAWQILLEQPALLSEKTRLIYWNHQAEAEAPEALIEALQSGKLQAMVCVSQWQRQQLLEAHPALPAEQLIVIANAVSPAFDWPAVTPENMLATKAPGLEMIYTSVPIRGLDILLTIFPSLRLRFPELRLKVYSSLSLYQLPEADASFETYYEECRKLDGIELLAPVGKTELAKALRQAHVLAFPASYPETSCLAIAEALASGCRVVSSNRGALPETTLGLAHLVPWHELERFCFDYFEALSQALYRWQQAPEQMAKAMAWQVQAMAEPLDWLMRVKEWENLSSKRNMT